MVKLCLAPDEIQEGDLLAYLEGAASSPVARHIARCPVCAAEVESLRDLERLFTAVLSPAQAIPRETYETPVWSGLSWQNRGVLNWISKFSAEVRHRPLGSLAALVILLATGFLFFVNSTTPTDSIVTAPQRQVSEHTSLLVAQEAAVPDVSREVLAEYDEGATIISQVQVGSTDSDPISAQHAMIRRRIIDVAVGTQIIVEENFEIAPPLELRRSPEGRSTELDDFSAQAPISGEVYRVKHTTTDNSGQQYTVWVDNRHGSATLYFNASSDDGRTWSQDIKIDRQVGQIFNPHLTIDEAGQLYLIWQNWLNIDRYVFYFARSIDDGQTWSEVIRIDETTGKTFRPTLAVDAEGALSLTWQHRRHLNTGIYITHSTDGGQTWSAKVRVANIGS